ncbi:YopX family protein [Gracilibacillus sp. HCP3S3_G5_1]|uniref:YopX family protein n=1 Tax=unclassified Gracilibacillus TaxID=2625209 RepID=UPI003F8C25BC
MNREIKFRGYSVEEMIGSQWMHGTGIFKRTFTDEFAKLKGKKHEYFLFTESGWVEVYEESIAQYTGLKDKNGKEIYEGDILSITSELLTNFGRVKTGKYSTTVKEVLWKEDGWATKVLESDVRVIGSERKGLTVASKYGVVIGNTYENPDLLEKVN